MNDHSYEYEFDRKYCYPDTDVLINKIGIRDKDELNRVERSVTLLRIIELDENPVIGNYDFKHLKEIHKRIFSDIYSWAGKIRTVDISKGTMFCKHEFIEQQADGIFAELRNEDHLHNLPRDKMIMRLSYYISEINAIHLFREGNGRAQRAFISQLSKESGYTLDFTKITDKEMILASYQGFYKNYLPMKKLIQGCIKENRP